MGTAGLVLGIISAVVFCLWPIAIILGILAVILGCWGDAGRRGGGEQPRSGAGRMICGAVGIALGIAMIVVFFVLPDNSGNSDRFNRRRRLLHFTRRAAPRLDRQPLPRLD